MHGAMIAGHSVLCDRIRACANVAPGDQPCLDLIEFNDGAVVFVQHIHSRIGWGQRVSLDSRHKPVSSTFMRQKAEFVGNAFLVHPSAVSARVPVPASMLRLQSMWNTGLNGGRVLKQPLCLICEMCISPIHGESALLTCPMCLTTTHNACVSHLLLNVEDGDSFFAPSLLPVPEFDRWQPRTVHGLDRRTCAWCWSYAVAPVAAAPV